MITLLSVTVNEIRCVSWDVKEVLRVEKCDKNKISMKKAPSSDVICIFYQKSLISLSSHEKVSETFNQNL